MKALAGNINNNHAELHIQTWFLHNVGMDFTQNPMAT